MQLRPVTKDQGPSYPSRRRRHRGTGGWVRVTTAAMAAAAGIWVSGCFGVELAGDVAAPNFYACADSMPAEGPTITGPGTFEGQLCGEQTAWADIEVEQSYTARLELSGDAAAVVHLIDPAGYEVAALTSESPTVDMELAAGTWTLAADSSSDGWGWFTVTLSEI